MATEKKEIITPVAIVHEEVSDENESLENSQDKIKMPTISQASPEYKDEDQNPNETLVNSIEEKKEPTNTSK